MWPLLKPFQKTKNPSIDIKSVKIDILSRLSDGNDSNLTHSVGRDSKTYVYDSDERLIKIIAGNTTYTYTPQGRIKSIYEEIKRNIALEKFRTSELYLTLERGIEESKKHSGATPANE